MVKKSKDDCPPAFWRVVADIGFGWPTRTRQERKRRTFTDPMHAARWVVAIQGWPSHHKLVAVFRTVGSNEAGIMWEECDLSEQIAQVAQRVNDDYPEDE